MNSDEIEDALLGVLRTRLLTVANLPAQAWCNTPYTPDATVPFLDDAILDLDSDDRELGSNPWQRTTCTYRAVLHYPFGTDAHAALAMGVAIKNAFRETPMTLVGQPIYLQRKRVGPIQSDAEWLYAPVTLMLEVDHP